MFSEHILSAPAIFKETFNQWHTRLSPRVPLFCSYHILTSSVIYYWTDTRQHGIYLLSRALLSEDLLSAMKAKLGIDSLAVRCLRWPPTLHAHELTKTTLELAMQRSTEFYWKKGVSIEVEVLLLGRFPYSTNFKLLKNLLYFAVCMWADMAHQSGAYPGFSSMKRIGANKGESLLLLVGLIWIQQLSKGENMEQTQSASACAKIETAAYNVNDVMVRSISTTPWIGCYM